MNALRDSTPAALDSDSEDDTIELELKEQDIGASQLAHMLGQSVAPIDSTRCACVRVCVPAHLS